MVSRSLLLSLVALSTTALAVPVKSKSQETWKDHIKRVVVLVQENRSFDTFAGGLTYSSDIDGVTQGEFCNPTNASDPNHKDVYCAKPIAGNVVVQDPNHGISGTTYELYGEYGPSKNTQANMQGFLTTQEYTYGTDNITLAAEVINYYTPDKLPVFGAMAENFVLFDRWFAAVPGPTNPNRAYITSGTSAGHGTNDAGFDLSMLPQKSIFEQLSEKGISWINYSNASGFAPDALFYSWTKKSGASKYVKPLEQFYVDAKAGNLPELTYINPECCAVQSFHPSSSITDGEIFLKQIYEAVRSSPTWNETLFILTFDEHGGFYDHVPPPINVPPGDSRTYRERAPDGKTYTFDFTRLGVRIPTILMSDWVPKGHIEHKGKNNGGEYSHTSIPAFLANMWGLDYLTPRVSWSSTFEHIFTDSPRSDSPLKLPDPVPFLRFVKSQN